MLTRSPVGATRSKDNRRDELGGERGFDTTEKNTEPCDILSEETRDLDHA